MTHICVGKLTIIGSDNGLSPGRRQAIIWTKARTLLIEPLGTNFSEILIAIEIFSFKKMHLKISSANWRPFCLGLNVFRLQLSLCDIYGNFTQKYSIYLGLRYIRNHTSVIKAAHAKDKWGNGYIWLKQPSDSKVHGANMRPIWGRQDPGGPHVGPISLAIWAHVVAALSVKYAYRTWGTFSTPKLTGSPTVQHISRILSISILKWIRRCYLITTITAQWRKHESAH